jgi:deferrochelatase/peroxidase EfeB
VATDAHLRLAHPSNNGGAKMLRRGYNFVDGSDGLGRMDAGLFFLAYVRDPRKQFIPIQMKLGLGDGVSEYLQHTGSALFAIPPGIAQGEYCSPKARESAPQRRSIFGTTVGTGRFGSIPYPVRIPRMPFPSHGAR